MQHVFAVASKTSYLTHCSALRLKANTAMFWCTVQIHHGATWNMDLFNPWKHMFKGQESCQAVKEKGALVFLEFAEPHQAPSLMALQFLSSSPLSQAEEWDQMQMAPLLMCNCHSWINCSSQKHSNFLFLGYTAALGVCSHTYKVLGLDQMYSETMGVFSPSWCPTLQTTYTPNNNTDTPHRKENKHFECTFCSHRIAKRLICLL